MAEPESETDAEKAGSNNSVRVGTRSDRKVVSANGMDTYSELSGEISVDVSHYESNRQISRRMDTHGIIVVERFATFHYY